MAVHLTFHGAARTVTGSCFLLEVGNSRVLVDCGMFQGPKSERELNYRAFPFDPKALTAVILSHAHIDHSGLLPKLVKAGYEGPIHATSATTELASVMLPDSGHIQETEVEQLNRRNRKRGRDRVQPIYTAADALACVDQFRPAGYQEWLDVAPGIRARFWNAGHILGSASIEVEARDREMDGPLRILFSADLGPNNKLLHPDPVAPTGFDFVLCESTYGAVDRIDATPERRRAVLKEEVLAAARRGGALLIPSFAVERTQEVASDLIRLMNAGEVPKAPVFIDSPLATKATRVFTAHAAELEDGAELVASLASTAIRFTESVEESKALDRVDGFHIVIAASGMCEAGRIRHRLKNWLWRDEATVLMVGYQAAGTLGRILKEGAPMVRIQGEEIQVRATIRTIDLYSGHADGPELADWVKRRLPIAHNVFLIHGEDVGLNGLKARLDGFLRPGQATIPDLDQCFELTSVGAKASAERAAPRPQAPLVGKPDWHNDYSRLLIEINDAIGKSADARSRAVLMRKLRRALEEARP